MSKEEQCFCSLNEWRLHDRYNCTCKKHCKRKNPVPEEILQKEKTFDEI